LTSLDKGIRRKRSFIALSGRSAEEKEAARRIFLAIGKHNVINGALFFMTIFLDSGPEDAQKNDNRPAKPSQAVAPFTQIVSNARGPYPQLEMVSVPTKRNRELGEPSGRRNRPGQADDNRAEAGAIHRITKRLADVSSFETFISYCADMQSQMGFVTKAYPTILTRIKAQIPANGHINKDMEDDIVTVMLEELLSMSPEPPVASGSGSALKKDGDIPGAWR
jgi:hypothetical protein